MRKIIVKGKRTIELLASSGGTTGAWLSPLTQGAWDALRNAASSDWIVAETIIGAGINNLSTHYGISRSFGLFDLASISGTIVSAYVILDNFYTPNNCDSVSIQSCNNIGSLVVGDYSNFNPTLLGYGNQKGVQGAGDSANIVHFNSAGIAKLNEKGTQRFIFRQGENDYSNTLPGNLLANGYQDILRLPKLVIVTA
jgi:hypothetical protein